jgi:hypothetical protein
LDHAFLFESVWNKYTIHLLDKSSSCCNQFINNHCKNNNINEKFAFYYNNIYTYILLVFLFYSIRIWYGQKFLLVFKSHISDYSVIFFSNHYWLWTKPNECIRFLFWYFCFFLFLYFSQFIFSCRNNHFLM